MPTFIVSGINEKDYHLVESLEDSITRLCTQFEQLNIKEENVNVQPLVTIPTSKQKKITILIFIREKDGRDFKQLPNLLSHIKEVTKTFFPSQGVVFYVQPHEKGLPFICFQ